MLNASVLQNVCVVTAITMHFNRSNVKAVNTADPKHRASEVIALWHPFLLDMLLYAGEC